MYSIMTPAITLTSTLMSMIFKVIFPPFTIAKLLALVPVRLVFAQYVLQRI
jgi:hypothetical protein